MLSRPTLRTSSTCLSAGVNALLGGAVFLFPIAARSIGITLHLSQSQLSTIALAGVAGPYPAALLVGKILDTAGPRVCSAIAALLLCLSFGWVSWELHVSGPSSQFTFIRLVLAFLFAGIGSVFSYFSAIFSASIALPSAQGLAFGVFMSLYGLSPLFLSLFIPLFYRDGSEESLNTSALFAFLAILLGSTHLIGSVLLPPLPTKESRESAETLLPEESQTELGEQTSLLPPTPEVHTHGSSGQSSLVVLKDPGFWILAVFCFAILGACEMVLSNIGTITLALPPSPGSQKNDTSRQVGFLSISNTASRVIIGPLLDILFHRQQVSNTLSQIWFLTFASLLLACGALFMALDIPQTRSALWVLSITSGIAYGTTWTLLPVLLGKVYSKGDLGRNFGIISIAVFAGTPVFSLVYATISDRNRDVGDDGALCEGSKCWKVTFKLVVATSLLSTVLSLVLWKKWRHA